MSVAPNLPVLWHIEISHFNEKARWALAHKGVEHRRRAPTPGGHMIVALWLTRGRNKTFPLLQLDGQAIGDSTAIIAALERRFPDPPLYPEDPAERRRALELEEFETKLRKNPRGYIAQPRVELSAAPTWCDTQLEPRRLDLRPFVLTGKDTWVLPGGLTRVALKPNSYVVNSSQGGGSKDTWVLGERPHGERLGERALADRPNGDQTT